MSTSQAQNLVTWLGLFVLPDKALIPTTYETDAGFHLEREPITEFDYRNREQFVSVLRKAIDNGNPLIAAPPSDELKSKVPDIQTRMKAKNWKEVERKSIHFSIELLDDEYVVTCSKRGSDGLWSREKEQALERSIPRHSGAEGVVEVILEHLRTRSDLPGLPLAESA